MSNSKQILATSKTKMAKVIHNNYLILPVLNRFGIELGFQNKTIEEICNEKQININFFLMIINSYNHKDYSNFDQLKQFPVHLYIDYLKQSHQYYMSQKIPELEEIVNDFIANSINKNKSNNKLIANFFNEYKKELNNHFEIEETQLFPYIEKLEYAIVNNSIEPDLYKLIEQGGLLKSYDEHNELEEKLDDLKNLIIKFLPPVACKYILEKLLFELFRMEADLNDHALIEDKVLVPKIKQLEAKILKISE